MDRFEEPEEMTYADIEKRKRTLRIQLHNCKARMKLYSNGLLMDYHRPESFVSLSGIRKMAGYVGTALYALKVLRSISRVTGVFKKH